MVQLHTMLFLVLEQKSISETDLNLEGEGVADGADVVLVGEEDAVVTHDHAVGVDVLLGPRSWPVTMFAIGVIVIDHLAIFHPISVLMILQG